MLFGRKIDPVIVAMLSGALLVLGASYASAADKGGPKKQPQSENIFADAPLAPAKSWTGCGLGIQGLGSVAEVAPTGSPIAIAAESYGAGVNARCAVQLGTMVAGVEVSHDWIRGDLHDLIGASRALAVTGKLGFLVTPSTQLYAHASPWARMETDATKIGVKHLDSWRIGFGSETRLSGTAPVFFDLRYTYEVFDVKDLVGPSIDAFGHTVRAGLTWQFQAFNK